MIPCFAQNYLAVFLTHILDNNIKIFRYQHVKRFNSEQQYL